jgi:diguanylate cyclase (GGDEF)-like protein
MKIYSYMLSNLLDYNMMELYQVHTNLTYSSFIITNINKDMMLNSDDEEKSFFSIVSNLHNVNFRSSYIYIYKDPVVHYQYEKWRTPENIYLKAFNIGDNVRFLEQVAQEMPLLNCINNEYTPDDRRFTFVLVPLFSNEEQYGLFVCELDSDYFSQIYSVAPQICAAIKMTKLLKELELNLAEAKDANAELEKISDLDELTGAYNRRGFYRAVNAAINSPDNRGKKAIFFLADLDNLKVINDTFGHKEGDFALKTSTDYLRGASREFYAVGRIGGDEFAAFTLAGDGEEPQAVQKEIYDSIKQEAACFNKKCPKPYNVTISLGSCSFKCGSGKLIQNYINAADERLYVDKKNKNRKVIKEEK